MVINSSLVRRSLNGAIHLRRPASSISDVLVDTTGSGAGFTTSQSAVYLQANTGANNLLVRRSGNIGILVDGTGITMSIVRVVDATNDGVHISSAAAGIQLGGFVVDSNQAGGSGVLIAANSVQLTACDVTNSMNHGIASNSGYTGTMIADCNILGNGRNGTGLGVSNQNTSNATFIIVADDNWWGFMDGQGVPVPPPVGVANGRSLNVQANTVRPTQRVP